MHRIAQPVDILSCALIPEPMQYEPMQLRPSCARVAEPMQHRPSSFAPERMQQQPCSNGRLLVVAHSGEKRRLILPCGRVAAAHLLSHLLFSPAQDGLMKSIVIHSVPCPSMHNTQRFNTPMYVYTHR